MVSKKKKTNNSEWVRISVKRFYKKKKKNREDQKSRSTVRSIDFKLINIHIARQLKPR